MITMGGYMRSRGKQTQKSKKRNRSNALKESSGAVSASSGDQQHPYSVYTNPRYDYSKDPLLPGYRGTIPQQQMQSMSIKNSQGAFLMSNSSIASSNNNRNTWSFQSKAWQFATGSHANLKAQQLQPQFSHDNFNSVSDSLNQFQSNKSLGIHDE